MKRLRNFVIVLLWATTWMTACKQRGRHSNVLESTALAADNANKLIAEDIWSGPSVPSVEFTCQMVNKASTTNDKMTVVAHFGWTSEGIPYLSILTLTDNSPKPAWANILSGVPLSLVSGNENDKALSTRFLELRTERQMAILQVGFRYNNKNRVADNKNVWFKTISLYTFGAHGERIEMGGCQFASMPPNLDEWR